MSQVEVEEEMAMPGLPGAQPENTGPATTPKPKKGAGKGPGGPGQKRRTREGAPGTPVLSAAAPSPSPGTPAPSVPHGARGAQKAAEAMAKHKLNTDIIRVLEGQSSKAIPGQATYGPHHQQRLCGRGYGAGCSS